MTQHLFIQPPVSEPVKCRKCGTEHTVHVVEGLGAPTHSPKICSKCGQPLPRPSASVFDQFRRQQRPKKRY